MLMVLHREKLNHTPKIAGRYLKSIVYGGLDGIITTFAVVAGVAGASLSSGIVLILGFANLIGDGISMAIGDYLSTKSEKEYHKLEQSKEKKEILNYPYLEKGEMILFYKKRGLSDSEANKVVSILSKSKGLWVDTIMREQLNMFDARESPLKNGLTTFFSFIIFGIIPLFIYVIKYIFPSFSFNAFIFAIILTAIALFMLGSTKVKITGKHWFLSGIETLLIGGFAAVAAYLVGYLLAGWVG